MLQAPQLVGWRRALLMAGVCLPTCGEVTVAASCAPACEVKLMLQTRAGARAAEARR